MAGMGWRREVVGEAGEKGGGQAAWAVWAAMGVLSFSGRDWKLLEGLEQGDVLRLACQRDGWLLGGEDFGGLRQGGWQKQVQGNQ